MTSDAGIFRLLGIAAFCFAGYSVMTGNINLSIFRASRNDSPVSFWFSVAAWIALALIIFFMPELRNH
ncbi:MAG: hypothetical protein ACRETA_11500 [Gammaproteobacteria bacterium]